VKKIKAWAVLVPSDSNESPGELRCYGNGRQWQYPIFESRFEARQWKLEFRRDRGKIVRVVIREALE